MQIGDILNRTYQIERPLGVGGQARVWQARHLRLPRRFAIKECPLTGAEPRELAERRILFERERDILAALSHPGHPAIPKISDFWEEPERLCIVLDLVEGETLIELLAHRGRVTAPEAINWGKQICDVLTYLHNWKPPIIYRDLSPDNVIIDRSDQLHLIDFGIARTFKPGQAQNTSSLGKVGYASPEHLEGGKTQTDVRSDIYTVGALLYHLLTGHEPIPVVDRLKQRARLEGGRALIPPHDLNHQLALVLEQCVLRAMELEPARRYQNAEEMARALEACSLAAAQQGSLPSPAEIGPNRLRTRPFDPAASWGGAGAPPAMPSSPSPHQRSAWPWPADQPTVPNQPAVRITNNNLNNTSGLSPNALTPRGPTSGPHINSGQPPAISGNLGPSPLRRMTGGQGEMPPGSAPSGPMPAYPPAYGQRRFTGPSDRVSAPGDTGIRRTTGAQEMQTPGRASTDMPDGQTSRALVPLRPGTLPRSSGARSSKLTRRQMLIGLGVFGGAVVTLGGAAFVITRLTARFSTLYTLSDTLPVQCLAWSPDSHLLASGGNNMLIKIWDMSSGNTISTLQGHSNVVQSLAWSRDGANLASASVDKTVLIWDALQGGLPLQKLLGHSDAVYSVAWSPDASLIASASADQTVRIWDPHSGGAPRQVLTGHSDAVYSVAWSPDGAFIASASNDGTIKIWDPHQGGPARQTFNNNAGAVHSVSWSPDSKYVASASHNKVVIVWDVNIGYPPAFSLTGPQDAMLSVAWSADGTLIAAGSVDHTVAVWDAQQAGSVLNTLTGHTDAVNAVTWSLDNSMLASASNDNTIIVWQHHS